MSKTGATAYTIGSATRRCAATGRELPTGERFVAALTQSIETEEFVRQDFCAEAWQGGARPEKGLLLLGFWRGVVLEAGAKKKLLIDDESLLDLFEQTGEESADGTQERGVFRFVLALILLRKRLLVQEGSRAEGGRGIMLVRTRGTPKPPEGPAYLEVVEPRIDAQSLARVTQQLSAVLSGEAEAGNMQGGAA